MPAISEEVRQVLNEDKKRLAKEQAQRFLEMKKADPFCSKDFVMARTFVHGKQEDCFKLWGASEIDFATDVANQMYDPKGDRWEPRTVLNSERQGEFEYLLVIYPVEKREVVDELGGREFEYIMRGVNFVIDRLFLSDPAKELVDEKKETLSTAQEIVDAGPSPYRMDDEDEEDETAEIEHEEEWDSHAMCPYCGHEIENVYSKLPRPVMLLNRQVVERLLECPNCDRHFKFSYRLQYMTAKPLNERDVQECRHEALEDDKLLPDEVDTSTREGLLRLGCIQARHGWLVPILSKLDGDVRAKIEKGLNDLAQERPLLKVTQIMRAAGYEAYGRYECQDNNWLALLRDCGVAPAF